MGSEIHIVHAELERVLRLRDQVRGRVLGEADVPEWWDELERKWDEVSRRMVAMGMAPSPRSLSRIAASTQALLEELREGYENVELS